MIKFSYFEYQKDKSRKIIFECELDGLPQDRVLEADKLMLTASGIDPVKSRSVQLNFWKVKND